MGNETVAGDVVEQLCSRASVTAFYLQVAHEESPKVEWSSSQQNAGANHNVLRQVELVVWPLA